MTDRELVIDLVRRLHKARSERDDLKERITRLTRLNTLYSSETSAPSLFERACCGTSCGCIRC
jgi:hypothetical protein